MRWKIQRSGHDPRQIDLLAIVVMIVVVIAVGTYLSEPARTHRTSSFIEPSQSVRW
jgi:cell division protein FtsW (lipid II flippase)